MFPKDNPFGITETGRLLAAAAQIPAPWGELVEKAARRIRAAVHAARAGDLGALEGI